MLQPLFNKNGDLIGWLDPEKHIFDTNMEWIAYLSNGHAWSSATGNWMGPINGFVCLDTEGKVIAWNPNGKIQGTIRPISPLRAIRSIQPIRPIKPISPIRPIRPITPLGGWSNLSIFEWINQ